jgi:ATP-dependent DNA helicase DinG
VPTAVDSRLTPRAAAAIRAAIRLAGGQEVCFVATMAGGVVESVRVVARGNPHAVLALPGVAKRGQMLLHNHPSGVLSPSDADMNIAGRLHDDGVGFGIVNNDATATYVVVEVPEVQKLQPLDGADIDADLGPDGLIAAAHAAYEDRAEQRGMARRVAELYNDGGVGLLEGGTGVGKSLAYLLPALRWSAANGERTVVSTATINLQEQLVGKDLPFLAGALTDQKVRFALLKGWHNYVCLVRLQQAKQSGASLFDDGHQQELDALAAWAERTDDGSLSDLPTQPRSDVWDEVVAESDLCQRARCSLFDKCFLFKARKRAAQADVVVVNHHLLLADVAVRRVSGRWDDAAVLPAYDRLIIDEGHHLEDAAASHLGATVSHRALQRLLNRLDRRGRGLITALTERLSGTNTLLASASIDILRKRLSPSVEQARGKSALLFDLLAGYIASRNATIVRLTDEFAADPIWAGGLHRALTDTGDEIGNLRDGLSTIRDRMEAEPTQDERASALLNEVRAVIRRLEMARDALTQTLEPRAGTPSVRWIEVKGRDKAVALSSVPLNLAPILRDDLFARNSTTVVTSATLATDPTFAFITERLGLTSSELEPVTAIYPSPFDYARQALLAVPDDIPAPNVDPSGHAAAVARIVADVAEASDGGMFVLFTSHRDVRQCAADLRARGIEQRWPLLVQGDDTRDALLGRFRALGRAILLGTSSFWEGVDVPGNALQALVIAKLPFKVPTEPMTAAHCEAITAAGDDPFMRYMIPHAALRLKQGFGRLIRTATDRGVVVLTDPRVLTKGYGPALLAMLPPARRIQGSWGELLPDIEQFFDLRE